MLLSVQEEKDWFAKMKKLPKISQAKYWEYTEKLESLLKIQFPSTSDKNELVVLRNWLLGLEYPAPEFIAKIEAMNQRLEPELVEAP